MARRKIEEINAGSMADIAFLLLIFFLVTTTMEVDAGLGKTLPLKLDEPPVTNPPVPERNVLEIKANLNDNLMVEQKEVQLEELYEIAYTFYTANRVNKDVDINMPNYNLITLDQCNEQVTHYKNQLQTRPSDKYLKNELNKWQTKRDLCLESPNKSYNEIAKSAVVKFEIQSKTSYGLYIEIHNILKMVVNDLRVDMCDKMKWGDYYELNENDPDDQAIIKKLRILIPERIIEPKIQS